MFAKHKPRNSKEYKKYLSVLSKGGELSARELMSKSPVLLANGGVLGTPEFIEQIASNLPVYLRQYTKLKVVVKDLAIIKRCRS